MENFKVKNTLICYRLNEIKEVGKGKEISVENHPDYENYVILDFGGLKTCVEAKSLTKAIENTQNTNK